MFMITVNKADSDSLHLALSECNTNGIIAGAVYLDGKQQNIVCMCAVQARMCVQK